MPFWRTSPPAAPALTPGELDAAIRRQIEATRDLSALVRGLGFDVGFAASARGLVAGLKSAIRADVRDFAELEAAVASACAQMADGDACFDASDRALLDEVAAAGDDRDAVLRVLNRDPVAAQLPFIERIPVKRGGLVSWRTPVDETIVSKRPHDSAAFAQLLDELDAAFAKPQRSYREPKRKDVLEALERVRRDSQREHAYLPTSLRFLDQTVETFLAHGAASNSGARFEQLQSLLRRLTRAEHALAAGDPPGANDVATLASDYVVAAWLHAPSLTNRLVALLLAPSCISVSVWYRRRRFLRVVDLLRQEVADGHYDGTEVARRLQQLEAGGAFFSSLVYPLLRLSQAPKIKAPITSARGTAPADRA